MQKKWIWQQANWPDFTYQANTIIPVLEDVLRVVAPLNVLSFELDQNKKLDLESRVLLDETLATNRIEGEILDRESVRSSIAKRLGVGGVKQVSRSSEALVDVLLESVRGYQEPLSDELLCSWHSRMFYEKTILGNMLIGEYRNELMQIISGAYGKRHVHYEAPCDVQSCVKQEMAAFLVWINAELPMSVYIKAAIAKFWFVTIHPFDDGNGRLSRIIAERCLAQAESCGVRLYSISSQIEKNKTEYYDLLEQSQQGGLDITEWIVWFLKQVVLAADSSLNSLKKVRLTTAFWDNFRETAFNQRQVKLINRLLETSDFEQGISRKKYKKLAHTTDITAARDLRDLVDKKILSPIGEGRGRKYLINEAVLESG